MIGGTAGALVGGVACPILIILFIGVVLSYNRLVRLRNQADASWAQIDVQLKRRHDLIPNLVETVRAYATHERNAFEAVVAARGNALAAEQGGGLADRSAAEAQLSQSLGRLIAVAEAYPDLKADQNYRSLQIELANTEDKIAYARQFFNSAVQSFNNAVQTFPSNLIAKITGFRARDLFQVAGGERGAVQVRF